MLSQSTDYSRVKYVRRKMFEKDMTGELIVKKRIQAICLCTNIVGIKNITQKNYHKFYNRLHLFETIKGPLFVKTKMNKDVPDFITKNEIKSLIGLKTNAIELTTQQFLKRFDKNDF
jgi:hypothetical protein